MKKNIIVGAIIAVCVLGVYFPLKPKQVEQLVVVQSQPASVSTSTIPVATTTKDLGPFAIQNDVVIIKPYYNNKNKEIPVSSLDTGTFEFISKYNVGNTRDEPSRDFSYVKDKNGVYYVDNTTGEVKLISKDVKNFQLLFKNNSGYSRDSSNIYLLNNTGIVVSKDVDLETVSVAWWNFLKDKNNVYYNLRPISGLDAKSFQFVGYDFVKDKNKVYLRDGYSNLVPKDEYDPETFEIVHETFSGGLELYKDKNGVYITVLGGMLKIPNLNTKTVVALDASYDYVYIKDDNVVYYVNGDTYHTKKMMKVVGADPKTFRTTPEFSPESDTWEIPSPYYDAEDATYKYLYGRRVAGDSMTQQLMNFATTTQGQTGDVGEYFKNDEGVYQVAGVSCQKVCTGPLLWMNEFDSKTFQVLGTCWENAPADRAPDVEQYMKDKNNVYCGTMVISGALPDSFVVVSGYNFGDFGIEYMGIAKDKDRVYIGGNPILGVDSSTMKVLGNNYLADRVNVYQYVPQGEGYKIKIISGANPATFVVPKDTTSNY